MLLTHLQTVKAIRQLAFCVSFMWYVIFSGLKKVLMSSIDASSFITLFSCTLVYQKSYGRTGLPSRHFQITQLMNPLDH